MSWKSNIVGSIIAIGAQSGLAKAPCPDHSPLHDTIGVVKADVRARMESRLRSIETEKRHQLVVMTVNSVEEYGYVSIEQMANAIGKDCGVGIKGENSGIVILYTRQPSRLRIETAATERYLEDLRNNRIINTAKQTCQKDISCGLDFITNEIDKIIRKEFPDQQSVQVIDDARMKAEADESRRKINEFLGDLALGGVIIIVIGGVGFGVVNGVGAINKRNLRQTLKKELFELSVRANAEAQKYPEWFQNEYCRRVVNAANKMQAYTDEQVDDILDSSQKTRSYIKDRDFIEGGIRGWEDAYRGILAKSGDIQERYNVTLSELNSIKEALVREGYTFEEVELPKLPTSSNPLEIISRGGNVLAILNQSIGKLQAVRGSYETMKGADEQVISSFTEQKKQYAILTDKYKKIYGKDLGFDSANIEGKVDDYVSLFRGAYSSKDMIALATLLPKKDGLLRPLTEAIREMNSAIRTYEELPTQIATREKMLANVKPNQVYKDKAKEYVRETGRDAWANFDLHTNLQALLILLATIRENHTKKTMLTEIPRQLRAFDTGFDKIEEYMGLGVALNTYLTQKSLADARGRERGRSSANSSSRASSRGGKSVSSSASSSHSRPSDDGSYSRSHSPNPAPDPAPTSAPWSGGGGDGFNGGGTTSDW